MRALFTLIKRQIVDNAVYFLAAIGVSAVLIIAIISITLSEDITYLSLYTVFLIITAPILVGIGSYLLGLVLVNSDKTSGITTTLSVLPIRRGQILIARLVTYTLIILTLLGPVTIIGAILWEFLGPPDWLFHNWLADTFIGISLMALACYCLGLIAARRAETFASALRALPPVPILMLLIVIKGFGWPLLAVLLPFLAVSLFRCWKQNSNRFMTNVATGFTALLLLAIPLYFGRHFCDGLLVRLMDVSAKVSPSGLLPTEIENDPNVESHSEASVRYRGGHDSIIESFLRSNWAYEFLEETSSILEPLGITEYFGSRRRGKWHAYSLSSSPLSSYALNTVGRPIHHVHLDELRGQLVYRRMITDTWDDQFTWPLKEVIELYVGPEGVSAVQNSNLGYFESPIIHFGSSIFRPKSTYQCLVYDRHSSCFFDINFENETVHKGPQLSDSLVHPIESNPLANLLGVWFRLPSGYKLRLPIRKHTNISYLPFVDESGQIHLLDPNTLELHGPTGYIPRPKTLFGRASSKPIDLRDYNVELVATAPYDKRPIHGNFYAYRKTETKGDYLGLVAGSLSRKGMWTSIAVFDKEGKKIKSANSKSTFFDAPGGPVLTITKYIFESLHPPVLTLASFFTAYSFEARSSHRALFLMPNSFVAMARDYEGNIFYMSLIVLLLMLPGILFAGLLGWRIERDAAIIGLSRNARRLWLTGTLVFGLPAYITYRLVRPKITLITCANCGKPRRTDTGICHRCGSKWDVPELTPPTWRVLNGAE